jgi:hypothetical protein
MAVTAIWNIRGAISKALAYVENPDKTINPEYLTAADGDQGEIEALKQSLEYVSRDAKVTDGGAGGMERFVTGINCTPETAMPEMMAAKRQFGKKSGNTAYHAYQSFTPGEATPQTAHEIGIALARTMWGGLFQVVVATHLDRGHLHNHFILNSVSFLDGKKYNDCKASYRLLREASDRLCREHGLSVIESPKGRGKDYSEWSAERDGKQTWTSIVKSDVDRAIAESMTDREFSSRLKKQGYEIKQGKDVSVKPPGKERFVRLVRNFGEDYSIERIRRRILMKDEPCPPPPKLPEKRRVANPAHFPAPTHRKIGGYYGLYLRYQYQIAIRYRGSPGRSARMHFLLREDIAKLDRIYSEMTLLRVNRIETATQLFSYQGTVTEKMAALTEERGGLRKSLRRKSAARHEDEIKSRISKISGEMKILRCEIAKCENIAVRSGAIKTKLDALSHEKHEEQKERQTYGQFR